MLCSLADLADDATVLSRFLMEVRRLATIQSWDSIWENSSINHDTSINGRVPLPGFNWYLDGLMGDWMVGLLWLLVH